MKRMNGRSTRRSAGLAWSRSAAEPGSLTPDEDDACIARAQPLGRPIPSYVKPALAQRRPGRGSCGRRPAAGSPCGRRATPSRARRTRATRSRGSPRRHRRAPPRRRRRTRRRTAARAPGLGHRVVGGAPSPPRPAAGPTSTRLDASRMSSVFGLNASPSSAIRLPASDPRCFSSFFKHPPLLQLVDLDHRGQELEVVAGVAGELLQRRGVLWKARAPEAKSRLQERRADPLVEAHAAGDLGHVGAHLLARRSRSR